MSYVDVTDQTFETEVITRSSEVPVVVDLWAPWCGPCRTLGPIIEQVIDDTDGKVVLVKVNVDENPGISQAFRVQSIPLVVAIKDGQPVDGFLGAQPEAMIRDFVAGLLPSAEEDMVAKLIAEGNEPALRAALDIDPGHHDAVVALAELLVGEGRNDEALEVLARIPETADVRRVAAAARVAAAEPVVNGIAASGHTDDDYDDRLAALLPSVKADEDARQQFVDLLELMGPDDPRTATYRKKLTAQLF
jgi:putative thioredoxin